jgi:hypothetical protein
MAIDFTDAMLGDTATMATFAKRVVDGRDTPFEKHHFVSALQKRADQIYPVDKLTQQQRFSRCMCDDETGRLLYKAVKASPGSEVDPAHGRQDYVERAPAHIGPAHARMASLATDRQKADSIPYARAYSQVYSHPDNIALRAAVQREHLEAALAGIHGNGGVTGTLSIQEAQRMEPAKDFTGTGDYSRDIARKSAEAQLQKLADTRHAAHPEESTATSYTKVLVDPANAAIRKAALVA